MRKRMQILSVCCGLTILSFTQASGQEEVLFSTLEGAHTPSIFDEGISAITPEDTIVLADDFELIHKSKITKFNFVGQFGEGHVNDSTLILGVHLFVINNDHEMHIPFSDTPNAYAIHFFIARDAPGLIITHEGDKAKITIDLALAGKELVLEADKTYGLALAPVINANSLSKDKAWCSWYSDVGSAFHVKRWKRGDTQWGVVGDSKLAFSVEGEKIVLGISDIERLPASENIFPNPSNGVFTITSNKEIIAIGIHNVNGQIVSQDVTKTFDLSAFSKGIYYITIIYSDGTQSTREIIKS